MPGEASSTGASLALDAMSGRAATVAATRYLALLGAAPADPAANITQVTELFAPNTNGYTRQSVSWSVPAGDPAGSSNTNTWQWTFTGSGVIYGAALVSTLTGTTTSTLCHYLWTLASPRAVVSGDVITVAAGDLLMTAD